MAGYPPIGNRTETCNVCQRLRIIALECLELVEEYWNQSFDAKSAFKPFQKNYM